MPPPGGGRRRSPGATGAGSARSVGAHDPPVVGRGRGGAPQVRDARLDRGGDVAEVVHRRGDRSRPRAARCRRGLGDQRVDGVEVEVLGHRVGDGVDGRSPRGGERRPGAARTRLPRSRGDRGQERRAGTRRPRTARAAWCRSSGRPARRRRRAVPSSSTTNGLAAARRAPDRGGSGSRAPAGPRPCRSAGGVTLSASKRGVDREQPEPVDPRPRPTRRRRRWSRPSIW